MKIRDSFEVACRLISRLNHIVFIKTNHSFLQRKQCRYQYYKILSKFNFINQIIYGWIECYYAQSQCMSERMLVFHVASKTLLREILKLQTQKIWLLLRKKQRQQHQIEILIERIIYYLNRYIIFCYENMLKTTFL